MILTASPAAVERASDADHAHWSRMRAHLYITPYGLEYRSN